MTKRDRIKELVGELVVTIIDYWIDNSNIIPIEENNEIEDKDYYTVDDVKKLFNIKSNTSIHNWIRRGYLTKISEDNHPIKLSTQSVINYYNRKNGISVINQK